MLVFICFSEVILSRRSCFLPHLLFFLQHWTSQAGLPLPPAKVCTGSTKLFYYMVKPTWCWNLRDHWHPVQSWSTLHVFITPMHNMCMKFMEKQLTYPSKRHKIIFPCLKEILKNIFEGKQSVPERKFPSISNLN